MRQQMLLAMLSLSLVAGTAVAADSQRYADIPLNPGEKLISVDGVPVNSGPASVTAVPSSARAGNGTVKRASATSAKGGMVEAINIEGNLVASGMPFSHTPGETALEKANHERLRNGVQALVPDPQLQQLALQKARTAASRGYKNHVGGSLGGARAEGVGHTNGRFLSCCLDMPATYGGAAMVQGADGWYCCLLVR